MSLTPPGTDLLAEFMDVDEASLDNRAEGMLQVATDLMEMATSLEDYPAGKCGRLMGTGILDMAWKLIVSLENRAEEFSPFNSERIGSYSYQKTYRNAAQAVVEGIATGVTLFDAAVSCIRQAQGGTVSVTSEHVFDWHGLTQHEIEVAERVWLAGDGV